MLNKLKGQFFSKWVACSLISDKQSIKYGVRFSYPIYILIVVVGVLLKNPYVLLVAALIAFAAIKLPLHPFDYIYNYIAMLIGAKKIPGRGAELQVNSLVALVFNLTVIALLTLGVSINFVVLAVVYAVMSLYFMAVFLFRD